jgi:hypothetical protein
MLISLLIACTAHHAISGSVVDRNGEPVERAIVTLEPGNVQIVTDQDGAWEVDYLRDEEGERIKLDKRTDYTVEAFKAGYRPEEIDLYYKRGELPTEPLVLKEDTIRVVPSEQDIDPDSHPDRTHGSGANYEGE